MVPAPGSVSSLTVQEDVEIVGHALIGTSGQFVLMQVAGDKDQEAGGFYLKNTALATVVSAKPVRWWKHKFPLKKNSVMTLTSTSGANPHTLALYVDDGIEPRFKPPLNDGEGKALYSSLVSAASGANTTALTTQMLYATTTLTNFTSPRKYKPHKVGLFTAMTGPTVFVGLSKGNDSHVTWWPVANTPAAENFDYELPDGGLPEFGSGERCNVHWYSEAAEQPRLIATFAYAP